MLKMLHKMSLRARLVLLTCVSALALLIALLSAWRTAQTSEAFALRQAESNVSNAVRDLLRESHNYPNGRSDFSTSDGKKKPLPHEKEIIALYKEPFSRSAAIALHRSPETAGGFCTADGQIQGFVAADNFGVNLSTQEREITESLCRQIQTAQDFKLQKINVGDKVLLVSAAPASFEADANETRSGLISGAFAVRRLAAPSGFGDWFSLLTQGFLLIVVVGLAGFSFLTWRDWQSGMKLIENGMRQIPGDLQARVVAPLMPELEKISDSINDLAANLDANLSRQKELEYSLIRNEKLAALGRVVAGVAHEVRNPLASMKLKIQLAERNKLEPEKLGKTFDVLREEINRLDNLVKKLLDVSRPAKLNLSQISLVELIEQRLSLFSEQAAAQKVHFEFYKPRETAKIIADRERLTQVFDNLFSNSLEAMPDGGKLEVSLERESNDYRIEVSDNGKGLTEIEREQLFEPFFTTKDNGTGLGLTISREIIEAHSGKIYPLFGVENGAAFIVELPLPREVN
jgi:signal transduction histidine kinase